MKAVRRLFALFWLSSAVGALAALAARRRVVPVDDPEANEVHLAAILGPLMFESTAPAFRGGRLDCWYGGGVVDLRRATLDPAGATVRVRRNRHRTVAFVTGPAAGAGAAKASSMAPAASVPG